VKFLDWDRLLEVFDEAETAAEASEHAEARAAVGIVEGIRLRVSVGVGERVSRRLCKSVLLERRLPSEEWNLRGTNALNVSSAAIARLKDEFLSLVLPVPAIELNAEHDIRNVATDAFGMHRPKPMQAAEAFERLVAGFSKNLGLVEHVEKYIRSLPLDRDMAFASCDEDGRGVYANLLISDRFLEDAALHDCCGHLVPADFYDPHTRSSALGDVDRAQALGRSISYKLYYANQWNTDQGRRYWRLRASVIADRLVFRMPFLIRTTGSLDYAREFNAIERVILQGFHHRGRVFRPIDGQNLLTMVGKRLVLDLLRQALFLT
jgi:hypothetical protein